jgi:hypothetical protein
VSPQEIRQALHVAANASAPSDSERALVALRGLLSSFVEATEQADRDGHGSMKAMSIEQLSALTQLYFAAGL